MLLRRRSDTSTGGTLRVRLSLRGRCSDSYPGRPTCSMFYTLGHGQTKPLCTILPGLCAHVSPMIPLTSCPSRRVCDSMCSADGLNLGSYGEVEPGHQTFAFRQTCPTSVGLSQRACPNIAANSRVGWGALAISTRWWCALEQVAPAIAWRRACPASDVQPFASLRDSGLVGTQRKALRNVSLVGGMVLSGLAIALSPPAGQTRMTA